MKRCQCLDPYHGTTTDHHDGAFDCPRMATTVLTLEYEEGNVITVVFVPACQECKDGAE